MNERLKELVKQADIHFHKGGTLDAGPNGIARFVLYSNMEKLAELIVKDALAQIQQEWYDLNNAPKEENEDARAVGIRVGQKNGVLKAAARVRKHFGIE